MPFFRKAQELYRQKKYLEALRALGKDRRDWQDWNLFVLIAFECLQEKKQSSSFTWGTDEKALLKAIMKEAKHFYPFLYLPEWKINTELGDKNNEMLYQHAEGAYNIAKLFKTSEDPTQKLSADTLLSMAKRSKDVEKAFDLINEILKDHCEELSAEQFSELTQLLQTKLAEQFSEQKSSLQSSEKERLLSTASKIFYCLLDLEKKRGFLESNALFAWLSVGKQYNFLQLERLSEGMFLYLAEASISQEKNFELFNTLLQEEEKQIVSSRYFKLSQLLVEKFPEQASPMYFEVTLSYLEKGYASHVELRLVGSEVFTKLLRLGQKNNFLNTDLLFRLLSLGKKHDFFQLDKLEDDIFFSIAEQSMACKKNFELFNQVLNAGKPVLSAERYLKLSTLFVAKVHEKSNKTNFEVAIHYVHQASQVKPEELKIRVKQIYLDLLSLEQKSSLLETDILDRLLLLGNEFKLLQVDKISDELFSYLAVRSITDEGIFKLLNQALDQADQSSLAKRYITLSQLILNQSADVFKKSYFDKVLHYLKQACENRSSDVFPTVKEIFTQLLKLGVKHHFFQNGAFSQWLALGKKFDLFQLDMLVVLNEMKSTEKDRKEIDKIFIDLWKKFKDGNMKNFKEKVLISNLYERDIEEKISSEGLQAGIDFILKEVEEENDEIIKNSLKYFLIKFLSKLLKTKDKTDTRAMQDILKSWEKCILNGESQDIAKKTFLDYIKNHINLLIEIYKKFEDVSSVIHAIDQNMVVETMPENFHTIAIVLTELLRSTNSSDDIQKIIIYVKKMKDICQKKLADDKDIYIGFLIIETNYLYDQGKILDSMTSYLEVLEHVDQQTNNNLSIITIKLNVLSRLTECCVKILPGNFMQYFKQYIAEAEKIITQLESSKQNEKIPNFQQIKRELGEKRTLLDRWKNDAEQCDKKEKPEPHEHFAKCLLEYARGDYVSSVIFFPSLIMELTGDYKSQASTLVLKVDELLWGSIKDEKVLKATMGKLGAYSEEKTAPVVVKILTKQIASQHGLLLFQSKYSNDDAEKQEIEKLLRETTVKSLQLSKISSEKLMVSKESIEEVFNNYIKLGVLSTAKNIYDKYSTFLDDQKKQEFELSLNQRKRTIDLVILPFEEGKKQAALKLAQAKALEEQKKLGKSQEELLLIQKIEQERNRNEQEINFESIANFYDQIVSKRECKTFDQKLDIVNFLINEMQYYKNWTHSYLETLLFVKCDHLLEYLNSSRILQEKVLMENQIQNGFLVKIFDNHKKIKFDEFDNKTYFYFKDLYCLDLSEKPKTHSEADFLTCLHEKKFQGILFLSMTMLEKHTPESIGFKKCLEKYVNEKVELFLAIVQAFLTTSPAPELLLFFEKLLQDAMDKSTQEKTLESKKLYFNLLHSFIESKKQRKQFEVTEKLLKGSLEYLETFTTSSDTQKFSYWMMEKLRVHCARALLYTQWENKGTECVTVFECELAKAKEIKGKLSKMDKLDLWLLEKCDEYLRPVQELKDYRDDQMAQMKKVKPNVVQNLQQFSVFNGKSTNGHANANGHANTDNTSNNVASGVSKIPTSKVQ